MKINELKAEIVRNGMTTEEFADSIGMARTTLWRRFENPNGFTLGEITKTTKILNLDGEKVWAIFFSHEVA